MQPIAPDEAALTKPDRFALDLIQWQAEFGRNDLPWQCTREPYHVWLSEVMLQQTQVTTVLGYFDKFLQRFPDVHALAASSVDDVLALWSGLGYYSRARNLHRCAQSVVQQGGGQFPRSAKALMQLPGIGRSTAAAIAAFCFQERVAILDGNVKRVLSRVLAFKGDLAQAAQERQLWAHATDFLPAKGVDVYTQGLMDLGAGVCLRHQPQCGRCPVHTHCLAAKEGNAAAYPIKTRKLKRSQRESHWLWLSWRDKLWLTQRPAHGVWARLWSLPEFADTAAFAALRNTWPGESQPKPSFVHTLTHLDWTLHPLRHQLPADLSSLALTKVLEALPPGQWFTVNEALALGLPAPLRKWLLSAVL
jgi:A/G-specific adenine glycosylase